MCGCLELKTNVERFFSSWHSFSEQVHYTCHKDVGLDKASLGRQVGKDIRRNEEKNWTDLTSSIL